MAPTGSSIRIRSNISTEKTTTTPGRKPKKRIAAQAKRCPRPPATPVPVCRPGRTPWRGNNSNESPTGAQIRNRLSMVSFLLSPGVPWAAEVDGKLHAKRNNARNRGDNGRFPPRGCTGCPIVTQSPARFSGTASISCHAGGRYIGRNARTGGVSRGKEKGEALVRRGSGQTGAAGSGRRLPSRGPLRVSRRNRQPLQSSPARPGRPDVVESLSAPLVGSDREQPPSGGLPGQPRRGLAPGGVHRAAHPRAAPSGQPKGFPVPPAYSHALRHRHRLPSGRPPRDGAPGAAPSSRTTSPISRTTTGWCSTERKVAASPM